MMSRRDPARRSALRPRVLILALLAVALVSCGASGASADRGSGSGWPTEQGRGMALHPCPGSFGSATGVGQLALVLTPSSPQATPAPDQVGPPPREGSAHIGDLLQVRLPITEQWQLSQGGQGVALTLPAGIEDTHLRVCA